MPSVFLHFSKLKPAQGAFIGLAPLALVLVILLLGKDQLSELTLFVITLSVWASQSLFILLTSAWAFQLMQISNNKAPLVFTSIFSILLWALFCFYLQQLIFSFGIVWLLADLPRTLTIAKIYSQAEGRKNTALNKFIFAFLLLNPLLGIWSLYSRKETILQLASAQK
jgi:O-antigen/teichoic acid export membrane protein